MLSLEQIADMQRERGRAECYRDVKTWRIHVADIGRELLDAAEAWAKLTMFASEGVFIGPKAGGFVVRMPYHDDFEATGETLEAAVAALYDKIGANEQTEKRDGN